jgi:thiol:disulfide interchange protein
MGAVAALLAGACVAPVVLAVLVLSGTLFAQGLRAGLVLPFVLGLGMAIPWPLAGAGLSLLPKPGAWMKWVKVVLGVFILAMAAYYLRLAYLGFRGAEPAAGPPDAGVIRVTPEHAEAGWTEALARARKESRPIFVDFWATWCKSCHAMEATTFKNAAVRRRLARFVQVKYQAERPEDPAVRETLEYFGVRGLPTYVLLEPPPEGSGP